MARGGRIGMVLEPVAGDGSFGKGGWSRWFAVASPSIDLSSAPGYMVILVGEAAVGTITFLGFGSWCGSW